MRRTAALLMAALICVLGLGGCASGDEGAESSPEKEATSSEPAPEEKDEAAGETDYIPGVEPADGPLVKMQTVTYRLPGGLETYQHTPLLSGARDATADTYLGITDVRITAGWDLDRQAREHRKAQSSRGTFERGPDVDTPVCTMFTFTGVDKGDAFFAEAGCEVAGTALTVKATQHQGRRGIVERILYPTLESLELR